MTPVEEAARLLVAAIPADPRDNVTGWPRWNTLLPHIDALAAHLPTQHRNTDLPYLHDQAATYLQGQGQLTRAIVLFERSLTDRQRVLGDEHPATLSSRNNLAHAYRSVGRLAEAISLFERSLTDRQRVLGDEHPATLSSRNNLAYAYRSVGRLAEAISLYEAVLTDAQRVLGDEHPLTRAIATNLHQARADS
jgi:tetratricopeptide (TPR) repeat protein